MTRCRDFIGQKIEEMDFKILGGIWIILGRRFWAVNMGHGFGSRKDQAGRFLRTHFYDPWIPSRSILTHVYHLVV